MKRLLHILGTSALLVGLPACSLLRIPAALVREAAKPSTKKKTEKTEEEKRGLAGLGGGNENTKLAGAPGGALPMFADPNAKTTADGLFDFSSISAPTGSAPRMMRWKRSVTEVMDEARHKGLLVVIFATHSAVDAATQMETQVLNNPTFLKLTASDILLLRVDYADSDTKRSEVYAELKRKLNIRGYPNLSIIQPDGKALLRLSGYAPGSVPGVNSKAICLQSIKETLEHAPQILAKHRKNLEPQGYRTWKDKSGRPVFARLKAVDANMLTFTTEWGVDFKTFESRLSDEDQAWIERLRARR